MGDSTNNQTPGKGYAKTADAWNGSVVDLPELNKVEYRLIASNLSRYIDPFEA